MRERWLAIKNIPDEPWPYEACMDEKQSALDYYSSHLTKDAKVEVVHLREVNPALDAAYLECEKALEMVDNDGCGDCAEMVQDALAVLRKARGDK